VNAWCKKTFPVFPEDEEFVKKFDCPLPSMCVACRHQRRAMFTPILVFHRRTSALSGKPILAMYSPSCKSPIYSIEEWWSDAWDAVSYGRPYNPSESFLAQFGALLDEVPRMSNHNEKSENCDFSFGAYNSRNCYYCRTIARSEDVFYSDFITGKNESIVDCYRCQFSQYLVECLLCIKCYASSHLLRCSNVRDSHFCIDCQSCSDCLFCHNLRNKSCHINNQPLDKETYLKMKREIMDGCYSTFEKNLERFGEVYASTLWKDQQNVNCENCIGDGLFNCADCFQCFNCFNTVKSRYCWELTPSETTSHSMDLTRGGIGELLYNCAGLGGKNYFARMCANCRHSSFITYCTHCITCKDCFGCAGLRNKQYCVLNKQYTKEEYERLTSEIIEDMRSEGIWGDFFAPENSAFAYNNSMASIYFPLSKQEILKRGWRWEDIAEPQLSGEEATAIPDSIDEIPDSFISSIITCPVSRKRFKLQKRELEIYRMLHLPCPRLHPDIRIQQRRQMINPYLLHQRKCSSCGKAIESTFSPDRTETVLCEGCYLREVY
jgi:hypothetical protein